MGKNHQPVFRRRTDRRCCRSTLRGVEGRDHWADSLVRFRIRCIFIGQPITTTIAVVRCLLAAGPDPDDLVRWDVPQQLGVLEVGELVLHPHRRLDVLSQVDHVADAGRVDALHDDTGARYDVIAVTASLPLYDVRFERMLAVGGRLFVVVGEPPVMDARLVWRTAEDSIATQSLFETVIDPLVNAVQPARFTF